MPAKGSEVIDIEVELRHETLKAWLVISTVTNKDAWIPKSVGEIEHIRERMWTLTLPASYAQEKGLI